MYDTLRQSDNKKLQNSVILSGCVRLGGGAFSLEEAVRTCSVEGCDNKHDAKGFCKKHYALWKRNGDPLITKRHGKRKTIEYRIWSQMIQRCYNKNHISYKYYGGRDIKVCDRWRNSFIAFYEDMGRRPSPKYQIDRINNNGNYEPDNCRWTTNKVNSRNSRWPKLTMELAEQIRKEYIPHIVTRSILAKKYNVSTGAISCVISNRTWV